MTHAAPRALSWEVNGLQLAGLSWGQPDATPLLALHGWLDNAASFEVLAPLLEHYHVVAVDLTGHGRSDCRSLDAGYQIWDDLPELMGVLDQLGWKRFSLMGHSRGAMIAALLASVIPERVDKLVLLDGIAPQAVSEQAFTGQLRRFLDDKHQWSQRRNRIYPTIEAAVASRARSFGPRLGAQALVGRNLRPCEGGFTWTTDLRLRGASAVKLSTGQVDAVFRALSMPTLLFLARPEGEEQSEVVSRAREALAQLEIVQVSGGHHFHMGAGAAIVAQKISHFLQS